MSGRLRAAPPNRRELLIMTLGAGGSVLLLGNAASVASLEQDTEFGTGLDRIGGAPLEALAALGRRYLSSRPELTADLLWAEVEERLGPWNADPEELRHRIVEAVRQDFAVGATVTVGGWVLARTTAQLGALAALSVE